LIWNWYNAAVLLLTTIFFGGVYGLVAALLILVGMVVSILPDKTDRKEHIAMLRNTGQWNKKNCTYKKFTLTKETTLYILILAFNIVFRAAPKI
jgi:predicted Co/Zn/Cd cation transporter (cation efflux family)